jgi:hypothetical protein
MGYKPGDYEKYHKSERMKKERASRNNARREAERNGQVKKGDGKHVDHRDGNPMNNARKNKRVIGAKANRVKQ